MSRSSRRSWRLSADGQRRRPAAAAAMVGEAIAIWNRRSRCQPAGLFPAARRMSPGIWSAGSAGLPVREVCPVRSGTGSGHGPAGAGRRTPVMVMPCSRATWVRNLRGIPVSASSSRRFLPAAMYSRSKNSRVRMARACCCRCHVGGAADRPHWRAGRGMCSSASRTWPVVVPSRAAASATGSLPVMMRWPTASRSMSSGSDPGRVRRAQQLGGGTQVSGSPMPSSCRRAAAWPCSASRSPVGRVPAKAW